MIKRSGVDGSVFPLVNGDCLMGRAEGCDIRVQLPTVSEEHCRVEVNENGEVNLFARYNFVFHLFIPDRILCLGIHLNNIHRLV